MVGGEGEGHDVLERHLLGDVELEKPGRDGGEAQALPDDLRRDEEAGRDVVFGQALVDQRLEGAVLVDRVQGLALRVLGEGIFLGDAGIAHDAGDGHGLVQALGLHKAFEGAIAPAAGRNLVEAGFGAVRGDDGADIEVLQQAAAGDVLGQFLDRHAGFYGADVGLAQGQPVEGDLADNGEGLDLGRFSHGSLLHDGRPGATLPIFKTRHRSRNGPLPLPMAGPGTGPIRRDRPARRVRALLAFALDAARRLAPGLHLGNAVKVPLGGGGGVQLLVLGLLAVPERRRLPALHGGEGAALGLQAVLQGGDVLVGLVGPLRGACLPVKFVGHAPAGRLPERGLQACRRGVRRLRLRQPGADRGHALAFALDQVGNLGGEGKVLFDLQPRPFLGVTAVLVIGGGAFP